MRRFKRSMEAVREQLSKDSLRICKYRDFSKLEAMRICSLGLDMIRDFINYSLTG